MDSFTKKLLECIESQLDLETIRKFPEIFESQNMRVHPEIILNTSPDEAKILSKHSSNKKVSLRI